MQAIGIDHVHLVVTGCKFLHVLCGGAIAPLVVIWRLSAGNCKVDPSVLLPEAAHFEPVVVAHLHGDDQGVRRHRRTAQKNQDRQRDPVQKAIVLTVTKALGQDRD